MESLFKVFEDRKYGILLSIDDTEIADEFDDFLNESCYVFVNVKFLDDRVDFYFGQAACIEKINNIIEKFLLKNKKSL